MSEKETLIDEDIEEDYVDPEEYERLKLKLKNRCDKAGLSLSEVQPDDEEEEEDGYFVLELPSGREKRELIIWDFKDLKQILSVDFEKYIILNTYEGICSYEYNTIEVLVATLAKIPPIILRRKLFGVRGSDDDSEEMEIEVLSIDANVKLTLSPASKEIKALCSRVRHSMLSLKLSGLKVERHDDAVQIMKRVSGAFFFQLDLLFGIAFNVVRARHRPIFRRRLKGLGASFNDIIFPSHEYDDAPLSLYWYARSAQGMPLLQFLAYYQVLEFYFPTYFQAEARRRIKRILKSPSFRADRDADIGRVLLALSPKHGAGGAIGDERSMLRSTLNECIDPGELRSHLSSDKKRIQFFSSKTKGLTSHKIPLANQSADLRNDVADRIYDIRCKIVHTKNDARDGEVELLLPFSKEAEQLYYDIELLRYLAGQVLISASSTLKLD